jgi:hypothetical protein
MSLALFWSARPDRPTANDDPGQSASYWCRTCHQAVSASQVFPNWPGMMHRPWNYLGGLGEAHDVHLRVTVQT